MTLTVTTMTTKVSNFLVPANQNAFKNK